MIELNYSFFDALRLAKAFADHDQFKEMRHRFDHCTLDEDLAYEISLEVVGVIFQGTNVYYNEENDFEIWVLTDPVIDQFCRLCRCYEERKGIGEEENPYMGEIKREICSAFNFDGYHYYDYNFEWKLSAKDRGRKRILFFLGPEFCGLYEMPMALLDIWDGFRYQTWELEAELGLNKLVPMYPLRVERKEAA